MENLYPNFESVMPDLVSCQFSSKGRESERPHLHQCEKKHWKPPGSEDCTVKSDALSYQDYFNGLSLRDGPVIYQLFSLPPMLTILSQNEIFIDSSFKSQILIKL